MTFANFTYIYDLKADIIAESFYSVKYGSSNIPSNIQLLIVNNYFFYNIISLD